LGSPEQSNNSPAEDFPSDVSMDRRQVPAQTFNPLTSGLQNPPQQNYGAPPQPNNGPRMVAPPNPMQPAAQSNGIMGGRSSRRRRRSRHRSRRRR
jgi:hypothetical protein